MEFLNFAERWDRDGMQVLRPPCSIIQTSVDMTHAIEQLDKLHRQGVRATHAHLLIRAAARALAANPDLHQMAAGRRKLRPSCIAIGLAVSGDTFAPAGMVLSNPHQKTFRELVDEITRRVPEAQASDRKSYQALRRWGWIVPFGFLRRAYLRFLYANPELRWKVGGALQISMMPAEWSAATNFIASGLLVGGSICSRVTVVGDQPAVRPMMNLTFSGDHGVYNGRAAARLISAIKEDLERGTL